MTLAIQRVVVQIAPEEKRKIVEKAKKLDLSLSELMRRGAIAYSSQDDDRALGLLADAAQGAAERSGDAIDSAMSFIAQSNLRIAAMETAARNAGPDASAFTP